MVSYAGKHAQYYDIFYQDKPYAQEAAVVHDLFQKKSKGECKRLLELACGTGRHALELEKLGYQIVATDYSQDLLDVAKQKAKQHKSQVDFRLQDMRDLSLTDEPFDGAYCLFDSIGYVQTNSAIQQVLKGVHSHLRLDGLFICEFWHAPAMLRNYEPFRERRWKTAGGELLRTSSTRLDVEKQLAHVTYKIADIRSDGSSVQLEETQVNRYFRVQEMASFLEKAGFAPLEWLAAFNNEPITENTWHILAVARRI
jgi:ubiquinone/menaquinone biosynthesis C-methylase UbiE